MLRLHRRVQAQPMNATAHQAGLRPIAPQPMVMPVTLVEITADGISVTQAQPLYTNRGVVPATGPGHWDQLYAAGKA